MPVFNNTEEIDVLIASTKKELKTSEKLLRTSGKILKESEKLLTKISTDEVM